MGVYSNTRNKKIVTYYKNMVPERNNGTMAHKESNAHKKIIYHREIED